MGGGGGVGGGQLGTGMGLYVCFQVGLTWNLGLSVRTGVRQ